MKHRTLLFRIAVLTLAYLLISFSVYAATTLIFQPSNLHPDYWELTIFDVVAQIICLTAYTIMLIYQLTQYHRHKTKK